MNTISKKRTFVFLLCFSSCLIQILAQLPDTVSAALNQKYSKLMKKNNVVGASVAIIDKGEIVYSRGFGYSDLNNQVSVTPNTIFPIGSSTKTFTALAVMQLHEKGLLDINKSIKEYIPELTIKSQFNDGNDIFIKDIMSHVSGLPCDIMNGMMTNKPIDNAWVINELNKQTTISPNRFVFAYSNVGYTLLGELISRVSGKTYAAYMKEAIFEPLEMYNTAVEGYDGLSKGYVKKKEISLAKIRDVPAGSITSTAHDMTHFLRMFLNEGVYKERQVISKEGIKQLTQNYLEDIPIESSDRYGFGIDLHQIAIKNDTDSTVVQGFGHSGYSPPYRTDYRYIPEIDLGVVVMSNTRGSGSIASSGFLLRNYLKEAKNLNYQYLYKESKVAHNCNINDLMGHYSLGVASIEVSNPEKIKFKVDGVPVILNRIDSTFDYSIKAKLLGFIPIKVKDVLFRFVKKEGHMYITQYDKDTKSETYFAAKLEKHPIPNSWKKMYGQYEIVKTYETQVEEFDFSRAKIKVEEQDGYVKLDIRTPDGKFPFLLNPSSESTAYSGGIGRQMNYQAKILENGNIYFSGFELRQQNKR